MKIPKNIDKLTLLKELADFIEKEQEKYPNLILLFKAQLGK